jgi:para-aminobenzoate synthetase component 1
VGEDTGVAVGDGVASCAWAVVKNAAMASREAAAMSDAGRIWSLTISMVKNRILLLCLERNTFGKYWQAVEIVQCQKQPAGSREYSGTVAPPTPAILLEFTPPGLPPMVISGVSPDFVLEGTIDDVRPLEEALAAGRQRRLHGGLGGVISYDGRYEFGFFPAWEKGCRTEILSGSQESYELELAPEWTQAEYMYRVEQTKEWIAAGDIYQACLTYPMQGKFSGSAEALYRNLRTISPAPMSGFWLAPKRQILSASPELFLDFQQREVRTRPIKGTRPRGGFGLEEMSEEAVAHELLGSVKERAELTMITDLERNDLGQFCEYGSVVVEDLLRLEKYAQVFHLVSTVRGHIREGVSHPAAVAACFPGGSITGAPKKRAREIIAELEGDRRGFYTGAMGCFGFDGDSRFNLMIRTLVLEEGFATYGTGAGIVADSDPATEWQETLAKARGVLDLCKNDMHHEF